jgi:sialate O-acetylesterase
MQKILPLLALAAVCLTAPAQAAVVPNFLFSNNAVLQRDKPIPVWGTADPGESVTVTFAGHALNTVAASDGKWRVDLPALPANSTGSNLVIQGTNTLTFTNVLVGEVWIASGQSNMEWKVNQTYDTAIDLPASERYPMIREIGVAPATPNGVSETPLTVSSGSWQVAGPNTAGNFSAIAYFYARTLYENLNVPVGIINTSSGGSKIKSWLDPWTLSSSTDPDFQSILTAWRTSKQAYPGNPDNRSAALKKWDEDKAAADAAGQPFTTPRPDPWPGYGGGPGDYFMPSGLYNAKINPLVPYALRGAIWYQGEGDSGGAATYVKLFPAMITGWRTQFGQGAFPFYWVQLSSFGDPIITNAAFMREAQTRTLSLTNTGQAVSMDLGESNIHPGRKMPIGRRLARVALARTYGKTDLIDEGPVFKAAVREGAGFRISFTKTDGQHRLVNLLPNLEGFEMAASDKVFKPAQAVISNDQTTVLVTSTTVPNPQFVRFGWRDLISVSLYNREGLPAVPFRTDQ